MKKYLIISACIFSLFSCKKKESTYFSPTKKSAQTTSVCGTPNEVRLLAGKHHEAGIVTVSNDQNNLYVTFNMDNGWELVKTHIFAGNCNAIPTNKGGNPQVGQFPFHENHAVGTTTYTLTLDLNSLPTCMCVATHAEVVKRDKNGNVIQGETAWGEGTGFGGGNWAMKFNYCKQECTDEPQEETCYQEETAWVSGPRYVSQGNWATYTPYLGAAQSINIYAGQTILVGTADFSAPDGNDMVQISINLTSPWALQNVAEPVKIQAYSSVPPASNPAPGQFNTYKGSSLTVNVPNANFYGIHLDVAKEISCN